MLSPEEVSEIATSARTKPSVRVANWLAGRSLQSQKEFAERCHRVGAIRSADGLGLVGEQELSDAVSQRELVCSSFSLTNVAARDIIHDTAADRLSSFSRTFLVGRLPLGVEQSRS
jgi:hypothetical protein